MERGSGIKIPWKSFWLLLAVFIVFSFVGYAVGSHSPGEALQAVKRLIEHIGPPSDSSFHNFMKIFTNNSMVALLMLLSGLFFGLGPWFIMAFNGLMVGLVVFVAHRTGGLPMFKIILALVPHGIIEIPAIAIAGVAGITWYLEIARGEGNAGGRFKRGMVEGFKLYLLSVALLFIAALVEAYVTPKVAGL
ncbi:stage II sporulation protein M [Thermococcus sp.]|uniref:stage II sporulation protein M n=1 Tax=Thermococcus sp. TaxID=35749 RepID=UPI00261D427A|nr:stage II sporulation protein M [Thermococcus sp.]